MKTKKGRYRLSPNEEAQLIKEETERRRKLRIIQVREQSKQNAAKIRQDVKQERDHQLQKLAAELQNQLEKQKEEKVRHMEAQYENCLHSIGQGHQEAGDQVDQDEERHMVRELDNKTADKRGKTAMEKVRRDKIYNDYEENKYTMTRKSALDVEKDRAAQIAALPAPPPDPVLNINAPNKMSVKMTDANAFSTTHYHMLEDFAVDKASPTDQEDARQAAEDEELRMKEQDQDLVRLHNDRLARARVRHNKALEAEILSHDYNHILMDLSDLQRADRERRQRVVSSIPKQVYEPPYIRLEDKEGKQKFMEEAFEDMYMAETNFMGDLSMALDPHPPPETPSASESLEVSTLDEVPLPQRTTVPSVLKDMTNTPKKASDKPPAKKPEKVLRKLMDKIKNQRQEWMSKSVGDIQDVGKVGQPPVTNGYPENGHINAPTLSEYSLSDTEVSPSDYPRSVVRPVIHGMKPRITQDPGRQGPTHSAGGPIPGTHKTAPSAGGPIPGIHGPAPLLHPMEMAAKIRGTDPFLQSQESEEEVKPRKPVEERTVAEILEQQHSLEKQKRELEAKLEALDSYHKSLLDSGGPVSSGPPRIPDYLMNGHESPSSSVNLSAVPSTHLAKDKPTFGFYGISELPAHITKSSTSSVSESPPIVPTSKGQNGLTSKGHKGLTSDLYHPLPVGAYLSSAARQQTNILDTSLPTAPQTVSGAMLPGEGKDRTHSNHMKKIREYQMNLMKRHDHSKQILANTRAEIEQRRNELLERFPQLELRSSESERSGSQISNGHDPQILSNLSGSQPSDRSAPLDEGNKFPPKYDVSNLLSRLASHPYYASRLSQDNSKLSSGGLLSRELQPEKGGAIPSSEANRGSKVDKVRKSLSFNDSLQESPLTAMQQFRDSDVGRSDLDDTALSSSSTERGSPALPGRKSGSDSDSDLLTLARDQDQMFEKRQADLRRQLQDIQKQKEEILQRHHTGQIQLRAEQERIRSKLSRAQRRINEDSDASLNLSGKDTSITGDTTGLETSDISTDTSPVAQRPAPQGRTAQVQPPPRVTAHQPHELSTIHEVDTPASAHPSDRRTSSGRPSISSSDTSTAARRSLEYDRPTIPEERERVPTPTERRMAGESGYHTSHIEEVMARARELDGGILDKLKQQTNDVFATLDSTEGRQLESRSPALGGSFHTLSAGTLSPSSLSTGPIDDSNASFHSQTASDNYAFRYVSQPGGKVTGKSESANGSFQSNKSWADELSGYKEKFKLLQPDRTSAGSDQPDFKFLQPSPSHDSDLSQHSLSDYDRSRDDSKSVKTDLSEPKTQQVDRSYDAVHFSVETLHPYQKPFSSVSLDTFADKPSSTSVDRSRTRSSIEKLAEELSHQGPGSDRSGSSRSSGSSGQGHMDIPEVRGSPVGHINQSDAGSQGSVDSKTRESIGSSMSEGINSTSSSYLDMELHGRNTRDFGPYRRDRDSILLQLRNELREENRRGPRILADNDSYNSRTPSQFAYTSTPYNIPGNIRAPAGISGISHSTITPNSSGGDGEITGIRSMESSSSSSDSPVDIQSSKSGPPQPLSQYSLHSGSDTQGITLVGKSQSRDLAGFSGISQTSVTSNSSGGDGDIPRIRGFQSSSSSSSVVDRPAAGYVSSSSSEDQSPGLPQGISEYSLRSDTQGITLVGKDESHGTAGAREESASRVTISLDSMGRTGEGSKNESSLTQVSMTMDDSDTSRRAARSGHDLSQYALGDDEMSLSQYSLDKSSLDKSSPASTESSRGLSQYSIDNTRQRREDTTQGLSQYGLEKTRQPNRSEDSAQGLIQYGLDRSSRPSQITESSHGLSQYPLSPRQEDDTQGLSQYGLDRSSRPSQITESSHGLSQYPLSPRQEDDTQGLSQYGLDRSSRPSQITESSHGLSQYPLSPRQEDDTQGLSQYGLDRSSRPSQITESSHGLSQYALSPREEDDTQGLGRYSLDDESSRRSADTTQGLSQYSLDTESEPDSEDGYVEQKFANLDVLIQESREIIAKHKELINRNANLSQNAEQSDRQQRMAGLLERGVESDVASTEDSYKLSTTTAGSVFDVTPLRYTEDSEAMVTSSLPSARDAPSADELGYETGISDEPNLTLVTLSSNTSMVQDDFTPSETTTPQRSGVGSHGTQSSNSTLSFEHHEASLSESDVSSSQSKSTQDTQQDLTEFTHSKSQDKFDPSHVETRNPNKSLSPPRRSPPPPPVDEGEDTGSDSGSDTLFHAVPIIVSPTLSLSMKFSSQQEFTRPPVPWSKLLDEEERKNKESKTDKAPAKPIIMRSLDAGSVPKSSEFRMALSLDLSAARAATEPNMPLQRSLDSSESSMGTRLGDKVGERRKMFEVADEPAKVKKKSVPKVPGTYLNKALQVNKDGDKKAPVKEVPKSPSGKVTSGAVVSLADFLTSHDVDFSALKRNLGEQSEPPASAPTGRKNRADTDESGVTRSVGPTGLSKTLASWKKSRSVKSAAPPPQPILSRAPPISSVRVLPMDSDISEEDRRRATDKIVYERHMRAYNPRLFRLANRLDDEEPLKPENREQQRQAVAAANRNKVKEFQKKLHENMKKKEQLKKQMKDGK